MMKKDDERIRKEYFIRQSRQLLAIAVALFLVLFFAVMYKRPDLFGAFSKGSLFAAQILCIAAFMGFTAYNWRCPSCRKYLGANVVRRFCNHCKAELN